MPASYSAARPTPLLVALHGGGGSMDHQADDARYGLIGKFEREGFILVSVATVRQGHRRNNVDALSARSTCPS